MQFGCCQWVAAGWMRERNAMALIFQISKPFQWANLNEGLFSTNCSFTNVKLSKPPCPRNYRTVWPGRGKHRGKVFKMPESDQELQRDHRASLSLVSHEGPCHQDLRIMMLLLQCYALPCDIMQYYALCNNIHYHSITDDFQLHNRCASQVSPDCNLGPHKVSEWLTIWFPNSTYLYWDLYLRRKEKKKGPCFTMKRKQKSWTSGRD